MTSDFKLGLCVIAGVVATVGQPASAQTNFYEGKTVSLIVANAAGGGYDASARALARHMRKHIPGVANVIVKNMPGAGGLAAANHMFNVADPDGLTFALLSRSSPLQPTLGFSAAKF
jgi:tripartite-type tricarboxylate transporter receptor subunit TctC